MCGVVPYSVYNIHDEIIRSETMINVIFQAKLLLLSTKHTYPFTLFRVAVYCFGAGAQSPVEVINNQSDNENIFYIFSKGSRFSRLFYIL